MGLISTKEAAERLGVHRSRVLVLIKSGRLPARRVGTTWVIDEADLELPSVRERRTGYPVGRRRGPKRREGE